MGDVLERTCFKCKKVMAIDVDNVNNVVYFKDHYYHIDCFKELAIKRASDKRCIPAWKEALDDGMRQIQKDASHMIDYCYGNNLLTKHLLSNYDIYSVSNYSRKIIESVITGKYKGKSKPISYRALAECWIAEQPELDKIYLNNKRLGKIMSGDQRVNYDLAVVVRLYPKWKSEREYNRQKIENRNISEQKEIKIDYNKIKIENTNSGLGDISDLLDEI